MQRIFSLSEHEVLDLQNSNTESFDGLAFFLINLWPRDIWTLFQKSEIGDTDNFKFYVFAFENNMSPHLLLNFLFIKYWKNTGKITKRISKHSGALIPSLIKNTFGITSILPNLNISI